MTISDAARPLAPASIARAKATRRVVLALFTVALLALGCARPIKIAADWDPGIDFSRLQTWKWAPHPQLSTGDVVADTDGLLSDRVEKAVAKTLTARGYGRTGTDEADFEVAWFLTIQPMTKVTTVNSYHGYGGGYYGYGGSGYGGSSTTVDNYNEGTLIIDVRDGKSGHLIWRGSGRARLKDKVDPNKAQERADDVIGKILAKFPPPVKDK